MEELAYNNKSVSCTNIPEIFLDKNVTKKYFNQFGRIHSFTLRPKRYSCTVEYETPAEAQAAINGSRSYNGHVFEMFYTPKERPKSRAEMDIIDPDVQSELDAMSGGRAAMINRGSVIDLVSDSTFRRGNELRIMMPLPIENKTLRQVHRPKQSTTETKQLTQVDLVAKAELETILRRQALTSEEKYRVLDARDKLIRLTSLQTKDIKNVVKMRGICPDMCPEKERLMREAKHQIGIYEADESSKFIINHVLAIKQYSRSSADQEAPLLHELRPEPVLKMTLNYLLHRIVDLCDSSDVNLSDWFHFLWDRTRAIRKDITQQELCSQMAVSLIEQCARFHIHCSARLVAEEPQVFDQKINTENLTKCLQSLKYMYHDLNLKHEQCPNEAEFRAYVVLLNLHDSNFLWEVKQLPNNILQSKEIRFAINVYLAMESNNYVKFFQLVRQTTYMNACILLRYFVQVRVRALNVMVKSYVPRAPVPMSISYWSYILAFEDYEQCAQFFEYYGLQCDRNDDRVLLDRSSFSYPDLPILIDRAINIVEHKRTCTVGEVIHGEELESLEIFEKHQPHDSFTDSGYLMNDAYTADDQNYYHKSSSSSSKQQLTVVTTHKQSNDEINLFKIPQIPSPTIQMKTLTKPSNFTKVSTRTTTEPDGSGGRGVTTIFGKPIAEDVTTKATTSSNIFKLSNDIVPTQKSMGTSRNIFQLPSTSFTSNNTGASSSSSNIFALPSTNTDPATTVNIFKLTASPLPDKQSSSLFGNFSNTTNSFNTTTSSSSTVNNSQIFSISTKPITETASVQQNRNFSAIETTAKEMEIKRQEAELHKKEEELKQIERQLYQERFRLIIDTKSNSILNEILNDCIAIELLELSHDELNAFKDIEISAEKIYNKIINVAIKELIDNMLRTEINNKTKQYLMFEYFWRWRINVRGRIEKRQQIERLERTPLWLPDTVSADHISQLAHPSQHHTIAMRKRYRQGTANTISLPKHKDEQIDIFDIVSQPIIKQASAGSKKCTSSNYYWKCIISVPDLNEDSMFNQRYDKLLNGLFKKRCKCDEKYFFCEQLAGLMGGRQSIAIGLRKFIGTQLINESGTKTTKDDVSGNNGILFFISMAGNLELSKLRLQTLLQTTSSIISTNATAFIVYNHDRVHVFDRDTICHQLMIDKLMPTHWNIEYFHCETISTNHKQLIDLIENSMKFIATNYNFHSTLQQQSTTAFLNQCLSDQFWKRIETSSKLNPALYKAVKNPNFIIHLYNTAIDRLINICTTKNIHDHPQFPIEFKKIVCATTIDFDLPRIWEYFSNDWQLPKRQKQWKQFLQQLKLSAMIHCEYDNFDSIQESILLFCQQNILSNEHTIDLIACKAISCIVQHLKSFDKFVNDSDDELTQTAKMEQFSWLPIIQLVAIESLTSKHKISTDKKVLPVEIIYNRQELADYTLIPWWLQTNSLLKNVRIVSECESIDDLANENDYAENNYCKKPKIQRIDDDELNEILRRSEKSLENANQFIANTKTVYDGSKKISQNFDRMLYEQERDIRVKKREWQIGMRMGEEE